MSINVVSSILVFYNELSGVGGVEGNGRVVVVVVVRTPSCLPAGAHSSENGPPDIFIEPSVKERVRAGRTQREELRSKIHCTSSNGYNGSVICSALHLLLNLNAAMASQMCYLFS